MKMKLNLAKADERETSRLQNESIETKKENTMYYDSLSILSSQVEYGRAKILDLGTRQINGKKETPLNGTESFDKKFFPPVGGETGGRRNKPSSILH